MKFLVFLLLLQFSFGCTNGSLRTTTNVLDGPIVTGGLVLLWDAAFATGSRFPGTGCAFTNWVDISFSGMGAALVGFSPCTANLGWAGSGSNTDPYRMSFNGGTDCVVSPQIPTSGSASFSIEAWINTSATGVRQDILSYGFFSGAGQGVFFYVNTSNQVESDTVTFAGPSSTATVTDGAWHNVVVSNNAGSYQVYVDGSPSGATGAPTTNIINTNGTKLSFGINSADPFNGGIAKAAVYNRALSSQEISQNCNALKHRFSSAVCH